MHNNVSIKYFIPDSKKEGGCYKLISGVVKKIDEYKQLIIMEDKSTDTSENILFSSTEHFRFYSIFAALF